MSYAVPWYVIEIYRPLQGSRLPSEEQRKQAIRCFVLSMGCWQTCDVGGGSAEQRGAVGGRRPFCDERSAGPQPGGPDLTLW